MSKFHEMSDIHLEFPDAWYKHEFPVDAEYLLLSGDATAVAFLQTHRTDKRSKQVQAHTKDFFKKANEHFKKVFYVFGNHEHYHGEFNSSYVIMKEFLKDYPNVVLLERESYELDDCVVLGATLWTSFNNNNEYYKLVAGMSMNDYHLCRIDNGVEQRFLPEDTYQEHLKSVQWLSDSFEKYKGKKIVVMTHHSPSKTSTHPKYADDEAMNSCYSSNLEHMMGGDVVLWVHGHTHHTFEYNVDGTRVVCNPRGYVHSSDLNKSFNPDLVLVV